MALGARMARIADKLSPDQIKRFLKATRAVEGRAVVCAVLADEEELVLDTELEEARADADWPQTVCDAIEDHANGQGPGMWRYAVKALRSSDERMCGSTWCRVNVRRGVDADGSEESALDGSVGSFVQQLQRSLEESTKANNTLVKTVVDTLKSQGDMVKALFDRQTELEKERAELIAENLEHAAKEAIAPPKAEDADEDPFKVMMTLVAPRLAEAAMDKLGPIVLKQLGIGLPSVDDHDPPRVATPEPADAPAAPETASAGPNPD